MSARFADRLARRARPQFDLVIRLIVWWPMFMLAMYGLRWVLTGIYWIFGERSESRFPVIALVSGLMIVGEWVRAYVKIWLRKPPGAGSLVATAVAGATVGALFSADIMLMWGTRDWNDMLVTAAISAVAYVAVDLAIRWDARRKTRAV